MFTYTIADFQIHDRDVRSIAEIAFNITEAVVAASSDHIVYQQLNQINQETVQENVRRFIINNDFSNKNYVDWQIDEFYKRVFSNAVKWLIEARKPCPYTGPMQPG